MKTIIITIALLLSFTTVYAQDYNYTQNGTTFVENKQKAKGSSVETKYTWEDAKGIKYPIHLSKNGRAFIKVTSKKTGNQYNKYLDEEISKKLCEEYNIKYTPKETKK